MIYFSHLAERALPDLCDHVRQCVLNPTYGIIVADRYEGSTRDFS